MWIKVWTTWAWGYSKEYEYHEVGNAEDIDNVIDIENEHNEWSDKYRGAKYEVIELPPEQWLEKEVERFTQAAKYSSARAEYLRGLLKK